VGEDGIQGPAPRGGRAGGAERERGPAAPGGRPVGGRVLPRGGDRRAAQPAGAAQPRARLRKRHHPLDELVVVRAPGGAPDRGMGPAEVDGDAVRRFTVTTWRIWVITER